MLFVRWLVSMAVRISVIQGYDDSRELPVELWETAPPRRILPLDAVLDINLGTGENRSRFNEFLAAQTVGDALRVWFGSLAGFSAEVAARSINHQIAEIDAALNRQINSILHHPRFQRLEATWRGVRHLHACIASEEDASIELRVLDASWREVERDFERAVEFDKSELFLKIYENEFGMAGGRPFGLLIGDFEIHPRPGPNRPHDDIGILSSFSQLAAAAFCPFVTNASPAMFDLDEFGGLQRTLNHARTIEQLSYLKWRSLRDTEDSRFLGLTLPHVLMRLPYEDDGTRCDGFCFREDVNGPDRSKYLWGGAAFAFGCVVIRAFATSGWFADIRGVHRGIEGGGLVTGFPAHNFGTDKRGIAMKCSTDVIVTDNLEKQLSELGFMPLCHCYDTPYTAFYSNRSVQKPKTYDRAAATTNAQISSMLQYMLCVSRFAHYIKALGRDLLGSATEPGEFQNRLQDWLVSYVTSDSEAPPEIKAKYPLREADVEVRAHPSKPGSYECIIRLVPHYELDEAEAKVKLTTEIGPARDR